ncbi:MAG: tripartite tricarboxylate transporter TctB family protein [Candidatus Binatia bacterium]
MKTRFPTAFLSLLFAAVALWAVFAARDWPFSARLFPWMTAIPLMVLSLVQLVIDLRMSTGETTKVMDFQFSPGVETALARRRTLNILAWVFGFALWIWLLGFEIAIPLMVFLYLKLQGQEGWTLSAVLTVVAYVFFWGIFDRLLHLPMPEARLFMWTERLLGW